MIDKILAELDALHAAAAKTVYDTHEMFKFANAAHNHYPALRDEIRRLQAELKESNGRASICVNAFKAFQMAVEGKITEAEFGRIITQSEEALVKASAWLAEYTNTAVSQIATLQAELATVERRGAAKELRRLVDEWDGTYWYWQAANRLRERAAELEGRDG